VLSLAQLSDPDALEGAPETLAETRDQEPGGPGDPLDLLAAASESAPGGADPLGRLERALASLEETVSSHQTTNAAQQVLLDAQRSTLDAQRSSLVALEAKNARMESGLKALRAASRVADSVSSAFQRERILAEIPVALTHTFDAAAARVWVVGPGDRCDVCPQLSRCADRKSCLHLVPYGARSLLDETLQRVPFGDYSVGRVAALAMPVVTNDLANEPGLANPAWARTERIVAFAGHPLTHSARLLGVVAMWTRAPLSTETLEAMRILARQASTAIAGAELIEDVRCQSRRSEEATVRLEALLESSRSGVLMLDPEDQAAYVNGAFRRLFKLGNRPLVGTSRQELEALLAPMLLSPAPLLPTQDDGTGVGDGSPQELDSELEVRLPDEATPRVIRRYGAAVRSYTGAPQGCMAVFDDVTHAREVDRMKTEFICTVSHELRTPLTSIKGSLGLLADSGLELDDESRELLSVSNRNVDRLVRLVNDILDLSKIEAGRLELRFKPMAPERLCADSVAGMQGFARRFDVSLETRLAADLPRVVADPDRVVQVLTNLLSNAIKFSPRGSHVLLAVEREAEFVRFSVVDHGPGIPRDFRDKLFTRFAQAERQQREQEGTGLGLAISQALVVKHGGEIGCQSEPGEGATLYFTLPAAREAEEPGVQP
jgi:signal transduction histidine kinase